MEQNIWEIFKIILLQVKIPTLLVKLHIKGTLMKGLYDGYSIYKSSDNIYYKAGWKNGFKEENGKFYKEKYNWGSGKSEFHVENSE